MQPVIPPRNIIELYPDLDGVILRAPDGVPEEDCGNLPALQGMMKGGIYDGGSVFRTFWSLSADDIEKITTGGVIEIAFFSNAVPPTSMVVHKR